MTRFHKFAAAASTLALLTAGAVHAQETTGGIKGSVTGAQGAPVAGATVTVVHEGTGVTLKTTTDSTGYYSVSQLRVGGPYKVTVGANGFDSVSTEVPFVSIGEPVEADLALKSTSAAQEVVIKGKRREVVAGRTRVTQEQIQTFPTLNRDIRDYALKSPSAYFDPTNSGALSIAGQNNRSNAILVDGVRQGDDFGLNANGLPTNRSPISVDSVEAVSVDTAPYDVQYSFFQGGVLNFVTKSGTNDFHGSIFYDRTGNDLRGKSFIFKDALTGVETTRAVTGDFSEKEIGANFSGPLLKDKVWFFALYEKFEGSKPNLYGASDSGKANAVPGVTNAQIDQVRNDIKTLYGFDPLGVPDSIPYTDTKKQLKIDYQINDQHRAVFSLENTQSGSVSDTGNSLSTTAGSVALGSKFYTLETDLKVYKGQLISHWTDSFSTEFNASRKEVVNISNPLGGSDFAQFKVCVNKPAFSGDCNVPNDPVTGKPIPGGGASIFLGPDVSRQENILRNNNTHFDLRAHYRWGDHNFLFGAEHERIDVFNAFVQNANGTYVFNSIAALEAKKADSITYANAADNVKDHGAATFNYSTNSLYAQDTWRVTPRLTVVAGLRWDGYTSKSLPVANATFMSNYGFTNARGLDGLSSLQPRISFNWRPSFDTGLTVYGGAGVYQGGNPNVWISNNYTNTGGLLGFFSCSRSTKTDAASVACNNALNNTDGFNVNTYFKTQNTTSANAGTGNTNALSPTFKMPSVEKASIGAQQVFSLGRFGDGYQFTLEYTKSKFLAAPYWQDLYQELAKSGAAPDGRPEYFGTVNGAKRAPRTDVVLTTAELGQANMLTAELYKAFHSGWSNGLSFDAAVTWQKSSDINSGTSSVATSSYRQSTWSDPNHPGASISNYQIDKIAKLTLAYNHKFFGDNRTSVVLYTQYRTGQRYSFVFQDPISGSGAATGMYGLNSLYTTSNVELFYVPKADSSGNVTLTSDPLVTYGSNMVSKIADFNTFLHTTGLIKYAGTISPRNGFKSPSNLFSNLHISQELPAINKSWGKLEAFMDINNFGNLINKKWGVLGQYGFPYNRFAVSALNCQASAVAANGTAGQCTGNATGNFYQYNSYSLGTIGYDTSSVYQIKMGLRYKF